MQVVILVVNFIMMTLQTHTLAITFNSLGPRMLPLQLGLVATVIIRFLAKRAIVPLNFIKQPVVIVILLYLAFGAASFIWAKDRGAVIEQLIFRFWHMVVPLYMFACAPK